MFQFIPNMGVSHQPFNPLQPQVGSSDNRTPYTGTFDLSAGGPNDSGYGAGNGPELGTSGKSQGNIYGVPYGGMSQFAGVPNGAYSGTYTGGGPGASFFLPSGSQLPGEGRVPNYYNTSYLTGGNPAPHAAEPPQSGGRVAPHAPEPGKNVWAGGIGTSDNSAWGNALGPTNEVKYGNGPLQSSPYQPQGHTNQALPMGYGSVFGLGGGAGR